jgi:hypothetical protein
MTSDLDEIIAEVAADLAHSYGLALDTAKRMVRRQLDEAWAEYPWCALWGERCVVRPIVFGSHDRCRAHSVDRHATKAAAGSAPWTGATGSSKPES